jgi:hypothetical protein
MRRQGLLSESSETEAAKYSNDYTSYNDVHHHDHLNYNHNHNHNYDASPASDDCCRGGSGSGSGDCRGRR